MLQTLGAIVNSLPLVNAVVADLPLANILSLSKQSNVRYISLDRALTPSLSNAAPAVNAFAAWQSGYTGAGVGIALIDSGVSSHQDLKGRTASDVSRGLESELRAGRRQRHRQVRSWHTHRRSDGGQRSQFHRAAIFTDFQGIAPQANIINLRVLDQNGAGTDSAVIHAISTAILLKPLFNIRVINLSLGRPVYRKLQTGSRLSGGRAAWKAGIVVVVAAGNNGRDQPTEGYGTVNSPGNDPYVITVGAMKTMGTPTRVDDLIASYSSKGPTLFEQVVKPDIVAPGNLLVSLEAAELDAVQPVSGQPVPNSFYQTNGNSRRRRTTSP